MRETVPGPLAGERLDRVIALLTGLSRGVVAELIERGDVRVGAAVVTKPSRKLVEGEVVDVDVPAEAVEPPCPPDPEVDVPVVWADDHVIVVDKPAGLVVHPGAGHRSGT